MTLGHIASQMAAKAVASDTVANKWQVFQHIRESRGLIGATDRSLSILNALLTFYPETALTGGAELVVWPSNEQLMARANGMPATTLRRHLAILVDCGLIIRRDSPNGKRFARKGRGGRLSRPMGSICRRSSRGPRSSEIWPRQCKLKKGLPGGQGALDSSSS